MFDDNEDEYTKLKLKCFINYPCYGNTDLSRVQKRFELYGKVLDLATEIEDSYGSQDLIYLVSTASQRAERQKITAEKNRQNNIVYWAGKLVIGVRKGMKLNSARNVNNVVLPEGVVVGFNIVTKDCCKEYMLVVVKTDSVIITRTK